LATTKNDGASHVARQEAYISGYGYALPARASTERYLEVDAVARRMHGLPETSIAMVRQFAIGSGVRFRHTVSPCWLPENERPTDVEDIFTSNRFNPSGHLRAKSWQELAPKLAIEAAHAAVENWGGDIADITHIVTTSTSGWSEPGISGAVIHELGLSLDTQKQELNFNGCFCGATCLRVARDIMRAGDAKAVLVVAVETPSIQYDPVATDVSSHVASVLFGDGASAFVLAREGAWAYEATGMSLVPNSSEMLRMAPNVDPDQPTYRMFLHRNIGARLATYFREERGAELLNSILERTDGVFPELAIHPGGPSILESVSDAFAQRGWPAGAMQSSIDTLSSVGNLGAAAVLLVMAKLLPKAKSDRIAIFAFGPGVTVEWGLIRRV
jgi:predicted naringenin-chalcone synthase